MFKSKLHYVVKEIMRVIVDLSMICTSLCLITFKQSL